MSILTSIARRLRRLAGLPVILTASGRLVLETPSRLTASYIDVDGDCAIGMFSYVNGSLKLARTRIGRFCSIGEGVVINPGNHPVNFVSTHPFASDPSGTAAGMADFSPYQAIAVTELVGERDERNEQVVIGHDVWIGTRAVILGGVTIGHGAVIAAGAVVTGNVEPYAIVAGVPARHLRYRLPQDQCDALLELAWWDWDLSALGPVRDYSRVQDFIDSLRRGIADGSIRRAETGTAIFG
ncbi:conserved hypothetical protein [Bosea sp. 62]|uniref:CatB-related O-acetyltransferase n=1 Tax=unclassified Bosea (in: a-proteobacteria) TaxID=2653178 RepID=UPI00125C7C78|nr:MULTISPECIES: CatB-related O-acetyltransferase [unclassified Bosea (in: a-proteobacteria)]CAD5292951.1 conserved hypothetical protein [Bosea sp. 21B]CAD5293555.1 conserved hypothetical protein [Bosea sp. 46]CAD5299574.1 conserved hypothetical protein [Bosea sp. 7B]VVT62219.1 conserved hypothetical protein [Bosea sp. EC-HK365B]VXB08989.1 conserved hypothetical protein [Bosea sp. 125]